MNSTTCRSPAGRAGTALSLAVLALIALSWGARAQGEAPSPPAPAEPAVAEEAPPAPASTEARVRRAPRHKVVVRKVGAEGRVFYLAEGTDDDMPAADLNVVVSVPQVDELIYETRTDKEGRFALPPLDVGRYEMVVGLLKVELEVMPPSELGEGQSPAQKAILILIPRNLGKSQEGDWEPPLRGSHAPPAQAPAEAPPPAE